MKNKSKDHLAAGAELQVHGGRVPPHTAGELTPMNGVDYGDIFTLGCPDASRWTAEAWGRAMFGDSPDIVERLIWQGMLNLQLTRRASPDHVAGWPVVDRSDNHVRLETRSWFLTGNLVVSTRAETVCLGTFVRYDRRVARAVWLPLSMVHRGVVPGVLRDAHRRLSTRAAET